MIWFFTPYSFEKKMFQAWEQYMNLVQNPNDWVCMMDGDTMFLHADFGHIIQEYIDKYPDTGIFTCYTSRSRTAWMMPKNHLYNEANIIRHKKTANALRKKFKLQADEINDRVTGHLMMMQKKTWLAIREEVKEKSKELKILSVDSVISRTVLKNGKKIRLMKELYNLHYYRLLEGGKYKNHIL